MYEEMVHCWGRDVVPGAENVRELALVVMLMYVFSVHSFQREKGRK